MLQFVLWSSLLPAAGARPSDEPVFPPLGGPEVVPPKKVDGYEVALIAAAHHFAAAGEADHLRAVLDRHPGWVDQRLKFVGNRKPGHGDQYTLLHRAAERGDARVVKLLFDRGADVEADGGGGWTPLHVAAKAGDVGVVRLLVERGANTDAETTPRPRAALPSGAIGAPVEYSGPIPAYTALEVARGYTRDAVIEFLEAKAKVPGPKKK